MYISFNRSKLEISLKEFFGARVSAKKTWFTRGSRKLRSLVREVR